MKKIFRFAAVMFIGALVAVACDPNNKPGPDPGKDPGKDDPDKDKPEEVTVSPYKIALDGAFSDWDAITEEAAKSSPFAAVAKGAADEAIRLVKMTSDANNIYFYVEFSVDCLPQNETCTEWGNSWDGTPEKGYQDGAKEGDDKFREVFRIYLDPDGDDKTGFYTQEGDVEGEPAITDLGCEMCGEWFCFFKPSTKLLSMAWNQTCVGPTEMGAHDGGGGYVGEATGPYDYNGTIYQSWPDAADAAARPVWGWQNYDGSGRGDNIFPNQTNWKPAVSDGTVAKVEFALEKKDVTNLKDEDEEMACGFIYMWGGFDQYLGPIRIQYSE
ncbi:MAG: hypothetical protein J6X71_03915 [Bacteroidales bacterium]|nr:hypothetical protein [Bacteroidales bacterium]